MPYATLDDLIERAGQDEILQVADRDQDDLADPAVIEAALAHADNTVNGYLAVRYAMPLSAVPPIVVTWAVSIARYHLHREGAPDYVVRDYKDALAALKDAARGLVAIPGADGVAPQQSAAGAVSVTGPEPVFSKDKLGGWL
ncbi:phage gp36-like protein [Rhizobium subbaraonis]|uniref:Phage gp36-like protein n=1 Tax=Rhizobium subbaraonis TaxID=908946 RepID=A0A285ULQ9_9HYPH|nr:DUF1320 domain-containing protein [Rhizobium subbaraonis]SOC41566.1 phage gp36-like protein [Rhizobium subbaraonis]